MQLFKIIFVLNPLVNLNTINEKIENLKDDFIKKYDCVIVSKVLSKTTLFNISTTCHSNNILFILGLNISGVNGHIFCDYGEKHIINDINGAKNKTSSIRNISRNGIVTLIKNHNFHIGKAKYFLLDDIKGYTNEEEKQDNIWDDYEYKDNTLIQNIESLNNLKHVKLKHIQKNENEKYLDKLQLDLSETKYNYSNFTKYQSGGIISSTKKKYVVNNRSLRKLLNYICLSFQKKKKKNQSCMFNFIFLI